MLCEIGRVCVKTAGKDAGKYCVIIDKIDSNFVTIDGEATRKRCNIEHLEPTRIVIELKRGSDKSEILDAMRKEGIKVKDVKKGTKEKNARKTSRK